MAIFSNIQHLINGVDIDTLLSQIEELTNELKKEKAEARKSISSLSSKLERAQKKNDTLKEDLTRESNKCHIAESKLAESESRIVSLVKENNELLKTEEKLKADLQKLGASNSSLNGKNLTLHNKVTKLEDQIKHLKDEINAKDSEISSVNKNAERIENRLKNEISLLDEAKNLVETLNEDNQQLKAEISIKTEENTIISSEVENLKKINQELNADREDKLQLISVLEKDIKKIQDSFESVTCDNNRLQQTCETISNDNQELKNKNEELSDRFTTLNSDFESLKIENDRVCTELELQKTALEQANAENTQLKNDLQTVQNEFSSAQEQLDVYGKNLDSLQSQIQILNSEKEELKPYMYLIDAKKEDEAKERALDLAKDTLQELVDRANNVLLDLKHDEVSTLLSSAISTAQELIDSAKDIAAIDEAKHDLDKSINQAQLKEQELIEEELWKIKEEDEAKERALNLAKDTLQELVDRANSVLLDLKHDEVSTLLSSAISTAQELIDSAKDITVIDEAKQDLNNSITHAQLKEQELIDEEQRKLKEEEDRKREEGGILQEEVNNREEEVSCQEEEDGDTRFTNKVESSDIIKDVESIDEDVFEDDSLHNVYDYGLIPADKLSIPEVYDVKEEKTINARDFFSQNENELILWRRNLQEEYLLGKSRFICPECKQPVKISGHKLHRGRVCYFAHFKDSDDCPYKTGTNRSKEEIERLKYSLVQESDRHKRLKAAIASSLTGIKSKEMGITNVECEKRINSDIPYLNWRRPDVYAEYNGKRFVFELQLSTTFVSVIVDRDIFYRLNDYNIIWVFNFEDNEEYVNLHNLMCKDIYYANKRNVFIFDSEAEEESKTRGELVLKCRWLNENGTWSKDEFVTLDMFKYDEENHKPYIVDADTAYLLKYPEYAERRKLLEHSREYLLKALMERQRLEEQIEENKVLERNNLQKELLNGNESVERYASGTKYGYQYNGITILPAKYTSAEIMGEEGYAKVGFNRKVGLVRKDGKEIVPVEYKNIDVINNIHGIVLASYKQIQLFLGEGNFCLCSDFDEKKQNIVREVDNGKVKYILQTSTYTYSYTQSYYGDHPICHKSFAGYDKSVLFSYIEAKDYCILWIKDQTFLLSKNLLSEIQGRYSEIISFGIAQVFIAKNIANNLWGVIDSQGNIITDFLYEELIPTNSEYLIVKSTIDGIKYGVIDYQGREFITPQFKALIYLDSEHFAFFENELWGICDRTGTILHAPEYTYICGNALGGLRASVLESYVNKWSIENNMPFYHDNDVKLLLLNDKGEITYSEKSIGKYVIRHSGDLYSIVSSDGVEKVNFSLVSVEFFSDIEAIIKHIDNKSGLFIDGKCVFFKDCIQIERLSNNVYCFINPTGKVALGNREGIKSSYLYDEIVKIDSNHFVATQNSTWGYTQNGWGTIPASKKIINANADTISCAFSEIKEFINGYAEATIGDRHGKIDIDGHMQENIVSIYGNLRLFEQFENYYFKNENDERVSEEFQKVEQLYGQFFSVKKRGESNVRIYSLETQELTPNSFLNVYHFTSDMFVVEETYGYGTTKTKKLYKGINALSPDRYLEIKLLENGYIALQKIGSFHQSKWILLRNDGDRLTDLEFDSIINASSEYINVVINGYKGFVDKNGEKVIEKLEQKFGTVILHCFEDYGLEASDGNVIIPLTEHNTSIDYLDSSRIKVCNNKSWALYTINGQKVTDFKFSSITFDSDNKYAVTENGIDGHIDSNGNYVESQTFITDDGHTIFVIMGKYGLKDMDGRIIISANYNSIEYLNHNLVAVKNENNTAIFRTDGEILTEFKYSEIKCSENGHIIGTRNNNIGEIDEVGNEIPVIKHFNGGYLKMSFGDYSIVNDKGETIIPVGYSKIELLENDNLFVLWKNNKAVIANLSNEKTDSEYDSVKSIGNGFYVVSRTIPKRIRVRKTGYGYYGNPYTYYVSKDVQEKKYGIIDCKLKTIIPCKYQSLSEFDEEQSITATNAKGEKNTITLSNLQERSTKVLELIEGTEYIAKVKAFMAIGIIVKIENSTYVIHKRYLYKEKNDFTKGELVNMTYLGVDKYEHPTWSTNEHSQMVE